MRIYLFVVGVLFSSSLIASSFFSRNTSCPDLKRFQALVNDPTKLDASCGIHNREVLEQISIMPTGGGYSLRGSATNVPLKMGNTKITNSKAKTSFCTGATYSVAMRVFEQNHAFDQMSPSQKQNFTLQHNDNLGFWGAWNNNYQGAGDANRLIKFGENIPSLKEACAGDFYNFNRKNKSGHSVVYLGQAGGKVYYWSSNKSTKGFGVKCEAVSNIVQNASTITRITQPKNIANIEKFSGKNYVSYYKRKQPVPGSDNSQGSRYDYLVDSSRYNSHVNSSLRGI